MKILHNLLHLQHFTSSSGQLKSTYGAEQSGTCGNCSLGERMFFEIVITCKTSKSG